MKKEILRINNLNYRYTTGLKLENVSLCILEGERVGLFGLTYSGKDLLVQLLEGETEGAVREGTSIYIEGKRISSWKMLHEKIYRITASNYIIDNWTVAEYIGLVGSRWLCSLRGAFSLEKNTLACLKDLGIQMDVSRKMRDLTEQEKRVVDLAKAYRSGAKIVIMEDEFEGMSLSEIQQFADTMKQMIAGKLSVIISSHSNESVFFLSDRFIIFNKGRIVKKCAKDYIKNEEHLTQFLFGGTDSAAKMEPYKYGPEDSYGKDIVYSVKNLCFSGKEYRSFQFAKGEIVTFLALNRKKKERIFMILAGRSEEEQVHYRFGSRDYGNAEPGMFTGEKIVSVKYLGSQDEVFAHMSVGENLLMPSLQKITTVEYIASSKKIFRMLAGDVEDVSMDQKVKAEDLEVNELIQMTLERWYIYNPKVLVLFEPFALCDIKGVSIVKSYIKKFAHRGTAVIVVKTREEYMEDISDRMVHLD